MRGWLILSCGLDGTVQSRFLAYLETIFERFGYSSGSQISDSGSLNLSTGRCQRKFYLYRFLSMEILYFPQLHETIRYDVFWVHDIYKWEKKRSFDSRSRE